MRPVRRARAARACGACGARAAPNNGTSCGRHDAADDIGRDADDADAAGHDLAVVAGGDDSDDGELLDDVARAAHFFAASKAHASAT